METPPETDHSPQRRIANEQAIIRAIDESLRNPTNMREENRKELLQAARDAQRKIDDMELFITKAERY